MNTEDDPRLTALAEALRTLPVPSTYEEWLAAVDRSYEEDAAAILAILVVAGWTLVPRMDPQSPDEWIQPAVWQGEVLRHAADIARLREALANTSLAYDTGFQDGLGEAGQIHADAEGAYVNEITRLREIEAAARLLRDDLALQQLRWVSDEYDALDDALEGGSE